MDVIVNADDMGLDANRNQAIIASLKKGYVTQASLMVNLEDTEEAVNLIYENGFQDRIGLHLNLTVGKPLSSEIMKCKLYCQNEVFMYDPWLTNNKKFIKNLFPGHIKALRIEMEAQIKKYLGFGFTMKRIDSHNWIHLNLPVWIALQPLLDKYGMNSIRGIRPGMMVKGRWKYDYYYRWLKKNYLKGDHVTIPYASNIYDFIHHDNDKYDGISQTELFVHPIMQDGEIIDNSRPYPKYSIEILESNIGLLEGYRKISCKELRK